MVWPADVITFSIPCLLAHCFFCFCMDVRADVGVWASVGIRVFVGTCGWQMSVSNSCAGGWVLVGCRFDRDVWVW